MDILLPAECGREHYRTPVIETSSTGGSKHPAVNIAHFRHSEGHWPRPASTLSFNSVRPSLSRPSASSSFPAVTLRQAPVWIPARCCLLPGLSSLFLPSAPQNALTAPYPQAQPFRGSISAHHPYSYGNSSSPMYSHLPLHFPQNAAPQTCIATCEYKALWEGRYREPSSPASSSSSSLTSP